MHSLQAFGNAMMSKEEFFVSYSVDVAKTSRGQEQVDLEERSMFSYVEILPLPSHNCSNTFIKLVQEEFILQVRVHLL